MIISQPWLCLGRHQGQFSSSSHLSFGRLHHNVTPDFWIVLYCQALLGLWGLSVPLVCRTLVTHLIYVKIWIRWEMIGMWPSTGAWIDGLSGSNVFWVAKIDQSQSKWKIASQILRDSGSKGCRRFCCLHWFCCLHCCFTQIAWAIWTVAIKNSLLQVVHKLHTAERDLKNLKDQQASSMSALHAKEKQKRWLKFWLAPSTCNILYYFQAA